MDHFNKLTPEQLEALAILAEECAEVVQVVGKILRHGLHSRHPNGGPDNQALLEDECGDLVAALRIVERLSLVSSIHVRVASDGKLQRVQRYMHHIKLGDEP